MALLDASRLAADSPRSLSERHVWRLAEPTLSGDLHPVAKAILRGSTDERPEAATSLRLTEHGINLLDGLYRAGRATDGRDSGGEAAGLGLHLTKSVGDYLGLDPAASVPVKVDNVTLLPFRTGIAVAVVELRLVAQAGRAPSLALLIEAMHLLGDERASRRPVLSWTGTAEPRFRFSDLVRALVAGVGLSVEGGRRIFSYACAVIDGTIGAEAKREIAFRLSRRYNYVYDPDVQGKDAVFLAPFNNVTHALSLEGAATVVDRPGAGAAKGLPEFLSNWLAVAHGPVYLPIAVIAYHEHLALLELAQEAAVEIDFERPTAAEFHALTRLCQRFLAFRLRYRPAQISRITMHNSFSEHVRLALGNDTLAQKAAQDAAEAERVLAGLARARIERSERDRERRWAWHGAFLAGLVALMAVLGLFGEVQEMATKIFGAENGVAKVQVVTDAQRQIEASWRERLVENWPTVATSFVALILGVLSGIISWSRLRHGEHAEAEAEKEIMQQQIDRKMKRQHGRSERLPRADS